MAHRTAARQRSSEAGGERFRYRFSYQDETFIVSMTPGASGSIDKLGWSLEQALEQALE